MKKDVLIMIVDDDRGHVSLIHRNLRRSGITNPILHFNDGQEVLDFLTHNQIPLDAIPGQQRAQSLLLLLDIRMPRVDGLEVLRRLKRDAELKKIPVIILSTTDDPVEIEQCYSFGCNSYITKPVKYEKFVEAIQKLAFFLEVLEVPQLSISLKVERDQRAPLVMENRNKTCIEPLDTLNWKDGEKW
jgi:CheY-like chemotaxis protein